MPNTQAQPALSQANGILKNAAIVVPLKYLSNFWRSREMSLINCKIELKSLNVQSIVFCLQMAMKKLMIILTMLFLLSETQNYTFLL